MKYVNIVRGGSNYTLGEIEPARARPAPYGPKQRGEDRGERRRNKGKGEKEARTQNGERPIGRATVPQKWNEAQKNGSSIDSLAG